MLFFFSLHAKYDCVWNYISLNCKSATTAILLKKIAYLWETLFMMSIRPKKNSWQEFVQSETSCTINDKNIFFKEVLPK